MKVKGKFREIENREKNSKSSNLDHYRLHQGIQLFLIQSIDCTSHRNTEHDFA